MNRSITFTIRPIPAASVSEKSFNVSLSTSNTAKTSPFEAVRVDAVARLTDTKSLGSVARNAADARTAALAADP